MHTTPASYHMHTTPTTKKHRQARQEEAHECSRQVKARRKGAREACSSGPRNDAVEESVLVAHRAIHPRVQHLLCITCYSTQSNTSALSINTSALIKHLHSHPMLLNRIKHPRVHHSSTGALGCVRGAKGFDRQVSRRCPCE